MATVAMALAALAQPLLADGTEQLGAPVGLTLAEGDGVVAAGVGLVISQPGTLNVQVPAGATVKQVLLYVSGYHDNINPAATMTFKVNSQDVTAERIGGPVLFALPNYCPASYRADITSLNLVAAGANALTIGEVDFEIQTFGAGVVVVFDLPDADAVDIFVRDGMDAAYHEFAAPLNATAEQVYTFPASDEARTATLWLLVGSAKDNGLRPNLTTVKIGDAPVVGYGNLFVSADGREWDTVKLELNIPAGVTRVAVQLLSEDPDNTGKDPASLVWVNGTLTIARPKDEPCQPLGPCTTATVGFWQNKNGQKLIKSLPGETSLGNWLAATFPNIYGCLAGKTNCQVAEYYTKVFKTCKSPKLDAQVLATALAVYVTNQTLAGDVAEKYGFEISLAGTGGLCWNVGCKGGAFGVPNNTTLTILELLKKVNEQSANGVLYGGNKELRDSANYVFTAINETGDIGDCGNCK